MVWDGIGWMDGWLDKAKKSFGRSFIRNGTVRKVIGSAHVCSCYVIMWHMITLGEPDLQDMCLMTDGRTDGRMERNLRAAASWSFHLFNFFLRLCEGE